MAFPKTIQVQLVGGILGAESGPLPDFKKVSEWIDGVLKLIFGDRVPTWISPTIGTVFAVGLILLGIWGILHVLFKIRKLWIDEFLHYFYPPSERSRAEKRRRLAETLKSRLTLINSSEAWQDYRFTELEAEVEAEGSTRGSLSFLRFYKRGDQLRRERSLAKALRHSQERLILVEGEPGSGKSVALRHVASVLADNAMKSHSTKSSVPLYINLKELGRHRKKEIDRDEIEEFVLKTVKGNDRDVEEFLEEDFERGMRDGSWLFLFDSFDELPDVLSSTEGDALINKYSEAIHEFLHGLNHCRGVIASRYFRGPGGLAWPRFRIQPLTRQRRIKLVRKINLEPSTEKEFLGWLDNSSDEFRSMASNPMFLGLLCNHIKAKQPFPDKPHAVFESYIETRLNRDAKRVYERYKFNSDQVRQVAEQVAFSMAGADGLGLNPSRKALASAMPGLGFTVDRRFESALDALEYIKLARSIPGSVPGDSAVFTFAHRRFQEYFATSLLLKESNRISPAKLLTNARWRESLVVLFQTRPVAELKPILDEAEVVLAQITSTLSNPNSEPGLENFQWPAHALHLCGLLQDGFGARLNDLSTKIREGVGAIIDSAFSRGALWDRKWALEVSGAAPTELLNHVITESISVDSQVLKNAAFLQAARLTPLPRDVSHWIRTMLVEMAESGTLRSDEHTIRVQLKRLDPGGKFIETLNLLSSIPLINGILLGLSFMLWLGIFSYHIRGSDVFVTMLYAFLCLAQLGMVWRRGRLVAYLSGMISIYFVLMPWIVMGSTKGSINAVILIVLSIYIVAWRFGAIRVAMEGRSGTWRSWLWSAPAEAIRIFARKVLEWTQPRRILESIKIAGYSFGGLAVLVILCGVAIRFGGSIAEIVIGVAFYGSILWWIGYSFFVKQVPKFVRWARNALLLRRFSRTEMTLDARTFENELAKFSDDLFRARAVRYVRDKDLLVSNESSLVSVKKLAAEVDIEVKRDIGRRLDIAEHLGIPAKLGIRAKLDSLAKLGLPTSGDRTRAKYLDELSLLIEKMNKKVVSLA